MKKIAPMLAAAALSAGALCTVPSAAVAVDEYCPSGTVALTFDDGSSYFRPQTLKILREKLVPATFLELGMRVAANPQLAQLAVDEGHTILNHTYRHDDLGTLSAVDVRYELLATEKIFEKAGIEMPFKGLRPPYDGESDTSRAVMSELGYVYVGFDAGGLDFVPGTPASVISETILNNLGPGKIILMHDGPADSAAGAGVVEALPQVIEGVRQRGYCFGTLDSAVRVVPDRLEPSKRAIAQIVNPVPYRPILFSGVPLLSSPPEPYAVTSGLPVRYLSVELDELTASASIVPSFANDLEGQIDAAESAQLRGDITELHNQLTAIAATIDAARSIHVNDQARLRLRELTRRILEAS